MALVAVQSDYQLLTSGRYQSFSQRWIERLPALGHEAREVDLFLPDPLDQLAGCDGLMWWFAHRPFPRNFATRLVAALHHAQRFPTFPNHRTCWHFDDKVAQHYLLRAARLPRSVYTSATARSVRVRLWDGARNDCHTMNRARRRNQR